MRRGGLFAELVLPLQPHYHREKCKWSKLLTTVMYAWDTRVFCVVLHMNGRRADTHRRFLIFLYNMLLKWWCSMLHEHFSMIQSLCARNFTSTKFRAVLSPGICFKKQHSGFSCASSSATFLCKKLRIGLEVPAGAAGRCAFIFATENAKGQMAARAKVIGLL